MDGVYGTTDDVGEAINATPIWVTVDANAGSNCADGQDRVHGFYSQHAAGANFAFGDGSTRFISDSTDSVIFRSISTIDGGEIVAEDY